MHDSIKIKWTMQKGIKKRSLSGKGKMTAEYKALANSWIMWAACLPGVAIVIYQAFLIFRKSKNDALRIGLNEKQVSSSIRSAAITSIGPCLVMITAMLNADDI